MITSPILAKNLEDYPNLVYPVLCTPKLDGIRALVLPKGVLSRSFKPIPNQNIRSQLSQLPRELDGELIAGKNFQDSTHVVMSEDNTDPFSYYIFDYVRDSLSTEYALRMNQLEDLDLPPFCIKLLPTLIRSQAELEVFEEQQLQLGYEGVIIRAPMSPYECKRSNKILKMKRFVDSEAIITGFEEGNSNQNTATKNELGHTKRSSAKAGKVPNGSLGKFLAREVSTGIELKIGTGQGLTKALRQEIWNNQSKYLNKIIKFKYQETGTKDKPRIPIFLGFRDERDIS